VLGHTDKVCPKLFELEHDDGTRGWGDTIRPLIKRVGTAATNKYLQDPIPSRPQGASGSNTRSHADFSNDIPHATSSPAAGNLDGRIIAVQKEISAIKSGILSAQKQALTKAGRIQTGAASSHTPSVSSVLPSLLENNTEQPRPVVLGLLAERHNNAQGESLICLEAAEHVDAGADLKKRKRAKATSSIQVTETLTSGVEGFVGPSLGDGMDIVISVHDNPMYDESDVTAGPEVQACREL
jgi:hypothetical protein